MSNKQLIIVSGMHRSGTSVITRCMEILGAQTGDFLIAPGIDNPKGYWEDSAVLDLDEEMLASLGSSWQRVSMIRDKDVRLLKDKGFTEKARNLILQRIEQYPSFVVKDPRMTKLLPFWKTVFDEFSFPVLYVIAIRNPVSVALSLNYRNKMNLAQGGLLWTSHILTSLIYTENEKRVIIDYDQLLQKPATVIEGISRKVHLPIIEKELNSFIDDFLDVNLRHSSFDKENFHERSEFLTLSLEIYENILKMTENKCNLDDDSFHRNIDNWREKFEAYRPLLDCIDAIAKEGSVEQETLLLTQKNTIDTQKYELGNLYGMGLHREKELHVLELKLKETEKALQKSTEKNLWKDGELIKIESMLIQNKTSLREITALYKSDRRAIFSGMNLFQQYVSAIPLYRKYKPSRFWKLKKKLEQSHLFDEQWYISQYPDVVFSSLSPWLHYLKFGEAEGRNPNPFFSPRWYLENNPDILSLKVSPLLHYMEYGEAEYRKPSPYFDPSWYLEKYGAPGNGLALLGHYIKLGEKNGFFPNPWFDPKWYLKTYGLEVTLHGSPLGHFILKGEKERKNPGPCFSTKWYLEQCAEPGKNIELPFSHFICNGEAEGKSGTPLFLPQWYCEEYPDAISSGLSPFAHYRIMEERRGYCPNPYFNPAWYLQENPDVAASEMSPLDHYVCYGEIEGRSPGPYFLPFWYKKRYLAPRIEGKGPLADYLHGGEQKGRKPCAAFYPLWYLEQNPEVAISGMRPLYHYMKYGEKEGRQPNPVFYPKWYLRHNPDVSAGNMNALAHFICYGEKETRNFSPYFDSEWYCAQYPEIDLQGLSPVMHYLERGRELQLESCSLPFRDRTTLPLVPVYISSFNSNKKIENKKEISIAIHLHISSLRVVENVLQFLKYCDYPFDLYLSVTDDLNFESLLSQVKKRALNGDNSIKIFPVVVPKTTATFAPMIIEFGRKLVNYDIVGHFYAGADSDSILESLEILLGTEYNSVCDGLFSLLEDKANLVYSGEERILGECNNGWGNCFSLANEILSKYSDINIKDFPVIETPAPFIFWAKGSALKEFLSLPFSYHNFHDEKYFVNGNLEETLKKLLFIYASRNGGGLYHVHRRTDAESDYRYYEEQRDYSTTTQSDIKVLSYYLPQFHPTPENDEWHGKGFTEWTKVQAANPLFRGHYQQHIPHPDIGYYLLDSPEVLRKQAKMMKFSGVYGQIFYHYWFTGKLILEKPAQMLLANENIEMPFCFCWANENWTRRWDGDESDVLLGQEYSPDDARAFIHYLIPFFKDRRYITIDKRPVVYVYRPSSIPEPEIYIDIWAEECRKEGLGEPFVVATLTRGAADPRNFKMDAAVERVLNDWAGGELRNLKGFVENYVPLKGNILDYKDVVKYYTKQEDQTEFPLFRSLVPSWDNTARYGDAAYLLHCNTPEKFQEWMESVVSCARRTLAPDRRYVVVNAWNEWAEGNHLEPDNRFGYAWLNTIGRVLSDIQYGREQDPGKLSAEKIRRNIHIEFVPRAIEILDADIELSHRFLGALAQMFPDVKYQKSTNYNRVEKYLHAGSCDNCDQTESWVLQIKTPFFCNSESVERMWDIAVSQPGAAVVPNTYHASQACPEVLDNGSVDIQVLTDSSMVLFPGDWDENERKQVVMCSGAVCFPVAPATTDDFPEISTIIRFHKKGELKELERALLCLLVMKNCRVIPCIAAQDLSDTQKYDLEQLVQSMWWPMGVKPVIKYYFSKDGNGDLRSKMLNEMLMQVDTQYAAFLDHDDLLFPMAYEWLVKRLHKTGKSIAYARVYRMIYNSDKDLFLRRVKGYEYGSTFEDFLKNNHSPIHSFMLDVNRFDFGSLIYHDDQVFMEDYFLLLQLDTGENSDRLGLQDNIYIGDYIFSNDRKQTLALKTKAEIESVKSDPRYIYADSLINVMKRSKE